MIENFEKNKHILTKLKNDENVKKSKNREHFIISVLKVGQGKNFCSEPSRDLNLASKPKTQNKI